MRLNIIIYAALSLALLLSCGNNSENILESHLENVTESIDHQKLDIVKATPYDSTGVLFDLIYPEMKGEFEKIKSESTLDIITNYNYTQLSDKVQIHYLIICYNLYMHNNLYTHGKQVNINLMMDTVNRIYAYKSQIFYTQKWEQEILVSTANDLKFNIGDTVNIVLPVQNNSTVYLGGIFASYKYTSDMDTLALGGVITHKEYMEINPEGKDSLMPVFDIKLLQMSKDVEIFGRKKSVGDTFSLDVFSYFRPIESGSLDLHH